MAIHPLSKRESEHELTRRALIKWTLAAGAALGVGRAKIAEILEKTAGKETAFAATASAACRSVHIVAGNGGLSWFQLMWPQTAIADSGNANFSYHLPGQTFNVPGTDNALRLGPDSPWQSLAPSYQMTGFVCGSSTAHIINANTTGALGGQNLYSIASAIQSPISAVVPLVSVGGLSATGATGGASDTAVTAPTDIVGLFNSAASQAGGLLSKATDASWYGVQYAAFAQLNRAAGTSVMKGSYQTATGAAGLLGTNLAAKLNLTAADETRYGLTNASSNIKPLGTGLAIAVKAFQLGLTNCIVLPGPQDDPHGAFASNETLTVAPQLKLMLDAFMADLTAATDDVTGESLNDITVITVNGDTCKDITHNNGNWDDATAGGANLLYVYGAGNLKTGWFGGMNTDGSATGYGADGKAATYNATNTVNFATASVAYAIARRDDRAITAFANGITIDGIFGESQTT